MVTGYDLEDDIDNIAYILGIDLTLQQRYELNEALQELCESIGGVEYGIGWEDGKEYARGQSKVVIADARD